MTSASLKDKPVRDLARLAKQHGVAGWHAMRKDQLIRALVRKARSSPPVVAAAARSGTATARPSGRGGSPHRVATPTVVVTNAARDEAVAQRLQQVRDRMLKAKNLATPPEGGRVPRPVRDRMVLMVRHLQQSPLVDC